MHYGLASYTRADAIANIVGGLLMAIVLPIAFSSEYLRSRTVFVVAIGFLIGAAWGRIAASRIIVDGGDRISVMTPVIALILALPIRQALLVCALIGSAVGLVLWGKPANFDVTRLVAMTLLGIFSGFMVAAGFIALRGESRFHKR